MNFSSFENRAMPDKIIYNCNDAIDFRKSGLAHVHKFHIAITHNTVLWHDWGLAITRTIADLLSIRPLRTGFSEIGMKTLVFLQMSSEKWRPFCSGLNAMKTHYIHCPRRHLLWIIYHFVLMTYILLTNTDWHCMCYVINSPMVHMLAAICLNRDVLII